MMYYEVIEENQATWKWLYFGLALLGKPLCESCCSSLGDGVRLVPFRLGMWHPLRTLVSYGW